MTPLTRDAKRGFAWFTAAPARFGTVRLILVWQVTTRTAVADFREPRRELPRRIEKWSLTSLQQRLGKTGCRLMKHARITGYCWQRTI